MLLTEAHGASPFTSIPQFSQFRRAYFAAVGFEMVHRKLFKRAVDGADNRYFRMAVDVIHLTVVVTTVEQIIGLFHTHLLVFFTSSLPIAGRATMFRV